MPTTPIKGVRVPKSAPGIIFDPITPHATNKFARGTCDWIRVNTAGNVAIVDATGASRVMKNCAAGTDLMVATDQVLVTGTTVGIELFAVYADPR